MNILFIHHGKGIGGAPLSLLNLLKELKNHGYKLKVLFIYDSDVVNLFREEKIELEVLNQKFYKYFYKYYGHSEAGYYKWFQLLAQSWRLISWLLSAFYFTKKILKKENPDILHLNSSVLTDWCLASRNIKAKKIIHIREPLAKGYFGIRRNIIRYIYSKYCDHIIAISKDNLERVNLPAKSSLVYNTIDFKIFNFKKCAVYHCDDHFKLLYLGGLHKAKGFNILVDALKYLDHNIQIIFCGYYSDSSWIKLLFSKMHKKLKIAKGLENVKILGVVNDIQNIMAKVDLVIFPATIPHFARPIIEAGAMGKPVIASDLPGMEELVINNETGLLVEPNNPKSLAISINELCRDQARCKKLGENGYKRAMELFTVQVAVKKIMDIYESVL